MVTPNRDRSVSIPRLEEDWEKAKLKGQGEIVRWASLRDARHAARMAA